MKKICIYIDGSCINNGKKDSIGSIGIYSKDINIKIGIYVSDMKITNQTMELYSCIYLLKLLIDKNIFDTCIYIYTDSTYVINCITKWYDNWEINNWVNKKGKNILNKEMIKELYELKRKYIIIFKHIKSHTPKPNINDISYDHWYGNYMADKLCKDAIIDFNKNNIDQKINNDDNEDNEDNDDNEDINDINISLNNKLNI